MAAKSNFQRAGVLIGVLAIGTATLVGCNKGVPAKQDSAPSTSLYPSYVPTVKARPAPTALPGNVITGN